MEIKKLQYNKTTGVDLVVELDQRYRYFKSYLDLVTTIDTFVRKSMDFLESGSGDYLKSEELLLDSEKILAFDRQYIMNMDNFKLATTESLRRRVEHINLCFNKSIELMENNINLFIPYTTSELEAVTAVLKECEGHLASFLLYQYGLDEFYTGEIECVFDVIEYWMSKSKIDIEHIKNLAIYLQKAMLKFRPSMGVFEYYPDLLEPFSALVGSDLYECEDITLDIVTKVLDGNMTITEFQEYLEAQRQANEGI
ncbi:hypothetical protein D3C81_742580 [compost metagenome]